MVREITSDNKDNFNKKLMTCIITAMLMLVTFSVFFIPTVTAGDGIVSIIMTTNDQNQNPTTNFDGGDLAYVVLKFDSGNENLTMYNVSLMNFNESVLGMANASIWSFENWTQSTSYEIHNSTGNITNINASGNLSGNNTAFIVNLTLNSTTCGVLYINVSRVQAWENNSQFSTINCSNISIDVHPKAPLSLNAAAINSSAVNITFSKESSADKIYVERNSIDSWQRGSGIVIGNVTSSFIVNNGLAAETQYYYQAWSWNNTFDWYSLKNTSTSVTTSQNGIFINGTIRNLSGYPIQDAEIQLRKFDMNGGDEGPFFMTNNSDSDGYFELNATQGGAGQYEFQVGKQGYVSYMAWDMQLSEDEYKELGIVTLPEIFPSDNQATIKGYINNSTGGLANGEVILLNMNFNYMIQEDKMEGEMDKNTTTNDTGYFEINASFASNYSIIAFVEGYYAQVNGPYEIETAGQTQWVNMTLDSAPPDDLYVTIEFTDLDDATITVNRTIRAESPVLRFALDSIPEIGNSNGEVSNTEVSDFLEFLEMTGPGFQLGEEDEDTGPPAEGEEEMGGGPDFLALPFELILDESTFDKYVSSSHNGTLENIAGTNASDNSSIFYNATFNITLDGKIINDIEHTFNITTEHNNTFDTTFTIIYNDFYNITGNASSTNVSITNTTSNLTMIPGENDTSDEALAYANITLELNQSMYSLPIIETPTWNITDRWAFNKAGTGSLQNLNYTLTGKPLRSWDRMQYYCGNEETRYLCYHLMVENNSNSNQNYVTINDLQWLSIQDNNISLSNDLDFPLYGGKTWAAITWWGDPANAAVISANTQKITGNGTIYNCVQINYTNISNNDHLIGQQWYSPARKFFVNRTQNVSDSANITWNLTGFSHGPFIESATVGNITSGGKIEQLYVNLTINVTNFYDGPVSYMLDGCLFKENFHGPPDNIMWVFDNSNILKNINRDTNPIYVNISFDGGIINASGINGPYTGQLEMRKDNYDGGDGFNIDMIDYFSFEAEYNYSDFIAPAATVVSSEVFGNGTQGSYNYLTLNATLLSADGGSYRMHAGIEKIINHSGGWQDWRWITGSGTDDFLLTADTETNITINFPGQDIYDKGYNGPYHINLQIENTSTHTFVYQNDWYVADGYSYDDFARPCVFFNKSWFSNYSYGDHDYLNASTYLTINTSITVSDASGIGDYELCGSVHIGNLSNEDEWGKFLTGTCNNQISLNLGENIIPLNFDIGEIQERLSEESSGNYTLKIEAHLSERVGDWIGPEIDFTRYYTQNYSTNDLPAPPISLDAFYDKVTNENLNISIYLNITSDEYANQTYELHGGVHHNNTNDGHWMFITGNWTEVTVQNPGNYIIYFHFSGMEIAGCGENGPYNVWLGLDKISNHQMVTNDEYTTTVVDTSGFAQPDVQFNDSNTSAGIWGSENFAVNVSLLVANEGNYHIGGGIHYVEHMNGWDNWMFLDGFGQECYLAENTNLTLNFSQSVIRSNLPSDYNGPLVIHLGIENMSNWQQIDHIEYETPSNYGQDTFSPPVVVINSTDVFINNQNDLQLNVTIFVTSEQDCNIHGGINDEDWWYITGDWIGDRTLTTGEYNISLNFSGSDIFNSMKDPAKIWFGIEKNTTYEMIANKEIILSGYTYEQFSAASDGVRILRENMNDGTVDYMNSSGSKTYLTVNVSINVTSGNDGTYWLDGGLDYVQNNNYEFITGTGQEIILSVGNQTIPLNYRASDIQASGKSGTYKAWISIRDMSNKWEDVDNYEYTTSYYSSDDAPAPPVSFVEKADGDSSVAYINNTGSDEYFTVNVTLNVTSGNDGQYDLHGGVNYQANDGWWQHISGTGEWVDLSVGQNNISLNFNSGEIKDKLPSDYNNNLSIWVGLNDIDDWEEITHTEYISKVIQKDDFSDAKVSMSGNNESVWGENFTVNLTINTSSAFNSDTYEIHGGLNYIETNNGWDEWRFITGFHENIALSSNNEITYSCNFSAGDVYTALQGKTNKEITAWISIENTSSWTELAHIEYRSANTYSGNDFNPPSITINCTGDFYNDAVSPQYLQVNLSINKTSGFDGSTTYEIHSGIHYVDDSNGWNEWRYVTGFYREITPNNNMTIPLNFSGTAIYETLETGPFEVWVGISQQGQWDDLAHDEYQTVTDYSTTVFDEPEIRIIESNITDYVNATGDLTINVTIQESNESQFGPLGDFVLEGCIHWKNGHQWKWIGWAETFFNSSSVGEYTVTLNFDGQDFSKAGDEGWSGGKLIAWFAIRNTTTWAELSRADDYETQNSYNPDDFSDPSVIFNTSNDPVETTDGTQGSYEWLNVTVDLTVNTNGTYQLYAGLFDPVNQTLLVKTNTTITASSTGETNTTLSFNGTKINNSGFNGTYEFRAKILSGNTEYDRMMVLLNEYNYTDFQGGDPEAWIENNFSSYLNSTNHDFVVNITINGSVSGNFEIYGDLFNSNTSTWITSNSTNITHSFDGSANYTISLRFNGTDISNSNEDGNYSLEYVRLSIDRDGSVNEVWEELEFMKNAYLADYHTHDEFGG
ncbi:MAG: hypothetical protein DRN27_04830 [Thermoplasmata archaeon]|nr:MAG: hypothetical protein DRN27_04830 [Thermoplasmata archaeon]